MATRGLLRVQHGVAAPISNPTKVGKMCVAYGDAKVASRYVRGFGWENAHAAVSRRPPTRMYTFAANVWDLSIVQTLFQTLTFRFATFASLYGRSARRTCPRASADPARASTPGAEGSDGP
jgi:hypothetical protein